MRNFSLPISMLLIVGCISQGTVSVSTDKDKYELNQSITVSIHNRGHDPIFFGGCNDFIVEKWEGEWKVDIQKICIWEGFPEKLLPRSKKNYEIHIEKEGTYRIRFEYGIGCEEGKPLSQASCSLFKTIYSEFKVEGP
jgi:hypothetical protein